MYPMTDTNTIAVTCNENLLIFHLEAALRRTAKCEPDFSRAVHFANTALLTQKARFLHEESCAVCRALEKVIN
jgi:hypothetical protein